MKNIKNSEKIFDLKNKKFIFDEFKNFEMITVKK